MYRRRNYSTPSTKELLITTERGIDSFILPLSQNNEFCKFPLHPKETLKELITDIRNEDLQLNTVVFADLDGNRFSHLISITDLLKKISI